MLVLNSPSNPLGAVLPAEPLTRLLAFARAAGLSVLSDECYDALTFEGPAQSIAALDPSAPVVSAFSFSKTYAMTGWRVGYAVGPADGMLAALLARMQEAIIGNVNAAAQRAALAALEGPQDEVERMRLAYRDRRDAAVALLDREGVPAFRPPGPSTCGSTCAPPA